MDRSSGRRAACSPLPGDPCPNCGGSGVLRTDAAGYRTCLVCVGQGLMPRFEATGLSSALAAAVEVAAAGAEAGAQPSPDPVAVRRRWRGLSAWSSGG
jgi:hypothetical protein